MVVGVSTVAFLQQLCVYKPLTFFFRKNKLLSPRLEKKIQKKDPRRDLKRERCLLLHKADLSHTLPFVAGETTY